jgi:hypothetical protein
MAASKTLIVNALESRYDYYSARNVLKEALRIAGLEDQSTYSDSEMGSFIEALAEVGDRVEGVLSRLQAHAGKPQEKASAKAAPAEEMAAPAEAPKAPPKKKAAAAKDKPTAAKKKAESKPKAAKKKATTKKAAKKK